MAFSTFLKPTLMSDSISTIIPGYTMFLNNRKKTLYPFGIIAIGIKMNTSDISMLQIIVNISTGLAYMKR